MSGAKNFWETLIFTVKNKSHNCIGYRAGNQERGVRIIQQAGKESWLMGDKSRQQDEEGSYISQLSAS